MLQFSVKTLNRSSLAPTMASRLSFLKMAQSRSTALKCSSTSTRRQSSTLAVKVSPFPELNSHLQELHTSLSKKVASIRTLFPTPKNHEIHDSYHIGPGVFIDPILILTSARVIGRVASPLYEAYMGSPVNKVYIGSTTALIHDIKEPVKLTPVAVSFASDVAVLKVVEREGMEFCPVAESPPKKKSILMAITLDKDDGLGINVGNVRAVGQKTLKPKAPWPLDDGLPWMEHDWFVFQRGPPPVGSDLFAPRKEMVSGSITKLNGSPWFNLYGEVVGVASWEWRDPTPFYQRKDYCPASIGYYVPTPSYRVSPSDFPPLFSVGYAAPLSNIWPVTDYAKSKGKEDPVVMDKWIENQENVPQWPTTIYT